LAGRLKVPVHGPLAVLSMAISSGTSDEEAWGVRVFACSKRKRLALSTLPCKDDAARATGVALGVTGSVGMVHTRGQFAYPAPYRDTSCYPIEKASVAV